VDLYEISCEEVLHEIEHFIDGELDSDQSSHLAEHIAACGTCLDHADFQRKLKEIVRTKCSRADPTPEHLLAVVRERIRIEGDRRA
jgi:anti-sigma factor (TIGR02949 family)